MLEYSLSLLLSISYDILLVAHSRCIVALFQFSMFTIKESFKAELLVLLVETKEGLQLNRDSDVTK